MKVKLYTGDDCPPCDDVEDAFRKKYQDEIAKGEAEVVNLDHDEDAQRFWTENELPVAPTIVVVSESEKVIAVLGTEELVKETPPA